MAGPTKWEKKPTKIFLEDDLSQLLNVFNEMAGTATNVLNVLSGGLTAVRLFFIDDLNPLLLALAFILDQMLVVIGNLKNSGVHLIAIYPSEETHSIWSVRNTEKILFKDIVPGFDFLDETGFYILNRDDIFKFFLESFDDEGDDDRPPSSGTKQITSLNTNNQTASSLGGTWFHLYSALDVKHYYVWYNVNGASTDPNPTGLTQITVSLTSSDNATDVINSTISAINAQLDFNVKLGRVGDADRILIENAGEGISTVASAGSVAPPFIFKIEVTGVAGFASDFTAGGVVIFAGALTSASINSKTLIEETLTTFCTIAELFLKLFNQDQFKKFFDDVCKARDDVTQARLAAAIGSSISIKVPKPQGANWSARKLVRDIIPEIGTVLTAMEGSVLGLKEQVTGASSALGNMIDFLDLKIAEIVIIQQNITDFLAFIDRLNTIISQLGKFELRALVVNTQPGGIGILKSAIADQSLTDRPSQDLFYCSLVSFISAGTGFEFLMFLLGLSDSFNVGVDTTAFSEDELKTRFDI